jgi:[ribosomal protein S18]-alanine N-acetyltransferase
VVPDPTDMPPAASRSRVRRAVASDLDDLVALEQRSFSSDRLSRAQYRRHLDSDSAQVLVASAKHHHFLGSAVLFFRKGTRVARLYSLATQPEARGRGLGAALLAAAANESRRRDCRALRLEVRTDNIAAISLYERCGFVRIGRYAHYYQDGADAWRYELALA